MTGAKVMFIEVTRVADRNFDNASLAKVNVSGMPDYADVDKDVAVRIMTFCCICVYVYVLLYILTYTRHTYIICALYDIYYTDSYTLLYYTPYTGARLCKTSRNV